MSRPTAIGPIAALSFLLAACLPRQGAPLPGQASLEDIARRPKSYVGRTIAARGWVQAMGEAPEGLWLEVFPGKPTLRQREPAAPPGTAQAPTAGGATFLLPARAAPGLAEELRGRQIEMKLRIDGLVTLPDGRRALRAWPLEMALPLEPVHAQAAVPEDVRAATEKLAAAIRTAQGEFFADPRLEPGRLASPPVRYRFLDPGKKRPFWRRPGPAVIEKSGPPEAPRYRFSAVVESENGYRKEFGCRFRVDAGRLRSVAYDEVVRNASGKVLGERHLDFLSGKAMDKVSGKLFRWPKNIYAAPCIGFALMGYPFAHKRIVNFFMWSEYDPFTTMYAIVDGIETVTVPAGTFECYRIRMNANIEHMIRSLQLPSEWAYGLARETAQRMRNPDTLLWFMRESPHLFVKMTGVMGPPGTSRGVVEITALDPAARAALAASRRRLVGELWAGPRRFTGQIVRLRFRVAAAGQSNGGRWFEAEPPEGERSRPRFFVPGDVSIGSAGEEVELQGRVRGSMSLDTGGRAVIIEPASR